MHRYAKKGEKLLKIPLHCNLKIRKSVTFSIFFSVHAPLYEFSTIFVYVKKQDFAPRLKGACNFTRIRLHAP